jgi:hypothetical protein
MNERIKELALQAEFKVYEGDRVGTPGYGDYIKDGALEKFAELIVKECCEVAHCNFHVDGLTLGGILTEHFGVEE